MRTLRLTTVKPRGTVPNFTFNNSLDDILDMLGILSGIPSKKYTVFLQSFLIGLWADGKHDWQSQRQLFVCHRLDCKGHVERCPIVNIEETQTYTEILIIFMLITFQKAEYLLARKSESLPTDTYVANDTDTSDCEPRIGLR